MGGTHGACRGGCCDELIGRGDDGLGFEKIGGFRIVLGIFEMLRLAS